MIDFIGICYLLVALLYFLRQSRLGDSNEIYIFIKALLWPIFFWAKIFELILLGISWFILNVVVWILALTLWCFAWMQKKGICVFNQQPRS